MDQVIHAVIQEVVGHEAIPEVKVFREAGRIVILVVGQEHHLEIHSVVHQMMKVEMVKRVKRI